MSYEDTPLWQRTLAPQGDALETYRSRLREAYRRMRGQAAQLVSMISADCRGLTVHDISHLDALWVTADLIVGCDFPINPAEAFVLGASFLIHDAGMSAAAFPNGIEQLRQTVQWKDAASRHIRRAGNSADSSGDLAKEFERVILFETLRNLHAAQAENLLGMEWKVPAGTIRLLEDTDLLSNYGTSIGRIAHSHHWDFDKLQTLRERTGAAADMPSDWVLNEVKLACILRCADAANIDQSRAPNFLYALNNPVGISESHWRFQNKLRRPTLQRNALLYSSGSDFSVSEASAWWLCYDTIRMVDRELSACSGFLEDNDYGQFAATRVYGADNPLTLAKQIRANGWVPVNAEIKVSSPAQLAKTLGGSQLYGNDGFAPIRELVQNSVDAIRARRQLESRPSTWGRIRVTFEPAETPDCCWLHVDDDGVGMSERVMTGPLLDFGQTFWTSNLLADEFPGLESSGLQPIGKYGIGFFSVFLLGDQVTVVSKRYNSGSENARALEFASINARPLVRPAALDELPLDTNTRVSVLVSNWPKRLSVSERSGRFGDIRSDYERAVKAYAIGNLTPLIDDLRQLVSPLDINVQIVNNIDSSLYQHSNLGVDGPNFLEELFGPRVAKDVAVIISAHNPMLRDLRDGHGNWYGKAALRLLFTDHDRYRGSLTEGGFVSVGGLAISSRDATLPPYVGVVTGDPVNVARSQARSKVPRSALTSWLAEQVELIDQSKVEIFDLMTLSRQLKQREFDSGPLKFCYFGGEFVSYPEFCVRLARSQFILLPVQRTMSDRFDLIGIKQLRTSYFINKPVDELVIFGVDDDDQIVEEELCRNIMAAGGRSITLEDLSNSGGRALLGYISKFVEPTWGVTPSLSIELSPIFKNELYRPVPPRWVVRISRPVSA